MANIFYIKHGNTLPVLEVVLKKPDGTPFPLTAVISVTMHVRLSTGGTVSRAMEIYDRPAGLVRYYWQAADWNSIPVGPSLPLDPGENEHRMEFEAETPSGNLTFPNASYDTLRVAAQFGE